MKLRKYCNFGAENSRRAWHVVKLEANRRSSRKEKKKEKETYPRHFPRPADESRIFISEPTPSCREKGSQSTGSDRNLRDDATWQRATGARLALRVCQKFSITREEGGGLLRSRGWTRST